jgi:pterin-4a-carbinolamine dehydratase
MTQLAFLSYRREDSREWATLIFEVLRAALGSDAAFMDIDANRAGDQWEKRIDDALDRAKVVMPIIGPRWLFVQDKTGRRRIDGEDDWVRREIERGLAGKKVIPILVGTATMPTRDALPSTISALYGIHAAKIDAKSDIDALILRLIEDHGFERLREELEFPPRVDQSPALSEAECLQWLEEHPGWSRASRPLARGKEGVAQELVKTYKFRSFEDAVHFMSTAARFITMTDHHPHWENQYKDLRVSLSTWDIKNRISYKDTRLAEYLDRLHREYALT